MYQWRKFEFFEEKSTGKALIPGEITGQIQGWSSGRGRIAVGCDDGTVGLLDRGFKLFYGFQAHASSVLFIQQLKEDTASMRQEIQDLRTNARIFQLSKCTACTFTLDLPAVHFMCMHSFHLRCLGDNEKECPVCAPEYRPILETKRNLEQNARDQEQFFQQIKNSKDGFSVIAEYFGKGIVSKTSMNPS